MYQLKSIIFLCLLALASCQNGPVVRTALGRIRGSLMFSRTNKTIYAFRGIRYGKSPEGPRRFMQAEPVDRWKNVFDASQEGPSCPRSKGTKTSSEDCLRLNVYTNCLPGTRCTKNRPVIVFIHPGGFRSFTAQSKFFGPQYLLDGDKNEVIPLLVTMNYRLGILGFISTGNGNGNLGLKDQVLALHFVQKNIASFGGDPNSVTIAGYSAGAISVILHMLSPMSKGLFHRAIAMSGSATKPKPLPTEQKDLVIKQAGFVGCPTTSLEKAFACLKTVPFKKLTDSETRFAEWYQEPLTIFSPIVEVTKTPGIERFLTDQPLTLIKQRKFHHVPLIIGINRDEFAGRALPALEQAMKGDDTIYRNWTANWNYAAPISFQYERGTARSTYISQELRKFYLHNQPLTAQNGRNLGLIYTDMQGWPVHRLAMLMSQYSRAPVYNYLFTYQGRYSFVVWQNTKKPYGVTHDDELQYLFYMSVKFPFFTDSYPEAKIVKIWTKIWKNFAVNGIPIPRSNEFRGVAWTPLDYRKENYLEIGNKLTMKTKMFPDRYALWNRLFNQ